jgi:hypothetical protein
MLSDHVLSLHTALHTGNLAEVNCLAVSANSF